MSGARSCGSRRVFLLYDAAPAPGAVAGHPSARMLRKALRREALLRRRVPWTLHPAQLPRYCSRRRGGWRTRAAPGRDFGARQAFGIIYGAWRRRGSGRARGGARRGGAPPQCVERSGCVRVWRRRGMGWLLLSNSAAQSSTPRPGGCRVCLFGQGAARVCFVWREVRVLESGVANLRALLPALPAAACACVCMLWRFHPAVRLCHACIIRVARTELASVFLSYFWNHKGLFLDLVKHGRPRAF